MNISLRNRVTTSFIIANFIVLVLGTTVFYFLDSLNKNIEKITVSSNKRNLLTDEIRISSVSILKYQRRLLTQKVSQDLVEKLKGLCDGFQTQLQALDSVYQEADVKKIIAKMSGYVEVLKTILNKTAIYSKEKVGLETIQDLADKILDAFSEFQDFQYYQTEQKDRYIKELIKETKKKMMVTLIITFLGTILLGLIVPGKIALPFKKINDAIRELQEGNFDVSIYYHHNDEIGEIAHGMNRMISSIKKFDELRGDRISMELRKFDALANMFKKYVMVANAKNELIYMNSSLYSLLGLESQDILQKHISETPLHESIKEAYEVAVKRRTKMENLGVTLLTQEEGEAQQIAGYANIVPIRGKDSSLDYYLMVISKEMMIS